MSDPTFDKSGNAAVGQFYSSGGQNDSTGREPFEDSIRSGAGTQPATGAISGETHHSHHSRHHESQAAAGITPGHGNDSNFSTGSEGRNDVNRGGARDGLSGNHTGDRIGGVGLTGDGGPSSGIYGATGDQKAAPESYGAVGGLGKNESQIGGHGVGHHHHHHGHHGLGQELATEHEQGRGLTGADLNNSSNTNTIGSGVGSGGQYGSNTAAADYASNTSSTAPGSTGVIPGFGKDVTGSRSGDAGADGVGAGIGHHGVAGGGHPSASGIGGGNSDLSSGAAGTDRFDSTSSGNTTYGHDADSKSTTNQGIGRHGDDFTGGAAATGGAYVDGNAKTGLTGRETTATGVQDQHGDDTQNVSLMTKVKNALGGHKNDTNATN